MRILHGREVLFSSLNTESFRKRLLIPIPVKEVSSTRRTNLLSLKGNHPGRQSICCDAACSTRRSTNGNEGVVREYAAAGRGQAKSAGKNGKYYRGALSVVLIVHRPIVLTYSGNHENQGGNHAHLRVHPYVPSPPYNDDYE